MTLTRQQLTDNLMASFGEVWAAYDGAPQVHYPNIPITPSEAPGEALPFARIWTVHTDGQRWVGSESFQRRIGQIRVEIYQPIALGLQGAYDLAERALEFFETYQPGPGETSLRNPGLSERGVEGAYYVIETRADFQYLSEAAA